MPLIRWRLRPPPRSSPSSPPSRPGSPPTAPRASTPSSRCAMSERPLAAFPSAVALSCREEIDDAQSDVWWDGGGGFGARDGGAGERQHVGPGRDVGYAGALARGV